MRRTVLRWLVLAVVGLGSWSAASGQATPGWAPGVVGPMDAGSVLDGGVVHEDPPFKDDAGHAKADRLYKDTVEFFLGFDPLEKVSRRDGGSRGTMLRVDAGVPDAS